jgi:8-oxo-dGTP pyrophosphatase MutT (NUDIX family)
MIFRRGKWDLPKGKLDIGETIEECALREVREETGIRNLKIIKLTGITYHEYFDKYVKDDVIKETHWFAMKVKGSTTLIPQTDEDIEKIIWANDKEVQECLQNTYPNIREIIEKFRRL